MIASFASALSSHSQSSLAPTPLLKELGAEDLPEIQRLFQEVFGSTLDAGLWHWKYGQGRGRAIGGYREGRLVSHYGGVWRDVRQGPWLGTGIQFVDVMVAKEARGVFSRRNPFSVMTQAFIDCTVTPGERAAFGFGFPNLRHFRLGAQLGLYLKGDDIHELGWDLSALEIPPNRVHEPLDWSESRDQHAFDQLCTQFHANLGDALAPVRRYDTWRHRFANHPSGEYACHWLYHHPAAPASADGSPYGAIALRMPGGSQDCELMDCVLFSPTDLPLAITHTAQIAAAQGRTRLRLWSTSWVVSLLDSRLREQAQQTHVGCFAITSRQLHGFNAESARHGCWLMGGDTDFR